MVCFSIYNMLRIYCARSREHALSVNEKQNFGCSCKMMFSYGGVMLQNEIVWIYFILILPKFYTKLFLQKHKTAVIFKISFFMFFTKIYLNILKRRSV